MRHRLFALIACSTIVAAAEDEALCWRMVDTCGTAFVPDMAAIAAAYDAGPYPALLAASGNGMSPADFLATHLALYDESSTALLRLVWGQPVGFAYHASAAMTPPVQQDGVEMSRYGMSVVSNAGVLHDLRQQLGFTDGEQRIDDDMDVIEQIAFRDDLVAVSSVDCWWTVNDDEDAEWRELELNSMPALQAPPLPAQQPAWDVERLPGHLQFCYRYDAFEPSPDDLLEDGTPFPWHDDLNEIRWSGAWSLTEAGIEGETRIHWPQAWLAAPRQSGFASAELGRLPADVLAVAKLTVDPAATAAFLDQPGGRVYWENALWFLTERIDPNRQGAINRVLRSLRGDLQLVIHWQADLGLGVTAWADVDLALCQPLVLALDGQPDGVTKLGPELWSLRPPTGELELILSYRDGRLSCSTHVDGPDWLTAPAAKTLAETADAGPALARLPERCLAAICVRDGALLGELQDGLSVLLGKAGAGPNEQALAGTWVAMAVGPLREQLQGHCELSWIAPDATGFTIGDHGLFGGLGWLRMFIELDGGFFGGWGY